MQRRGEWIWRDRGVPFGNVDAALDQNAYVDFRRTFELAAVPPSAPVRASADGRYLLYVNGVFIGRGPARCEPLFQYYDEYDVAPQLRAGRNTVAVLVHAYGRDMSWYELPRTHWSRTFGCGGLFFECDIEPRVDSDGRWACLLAEALAQDATPGPTGFAEVYDARRALDDGWTLPEYDDGSWPRAVVLRATGLGIAPDTVPFPHMVPRDIPQMIIEPRDAASVAVAGELDAPDGVDFVALAEGRLEPIRDCAVTALEAMLGRSEGAADVQLATGRAVALLLDFGRDVTGYPAIDIDGPAGATVDVSYSEQLDDGRAPVQRATPIGGQNVHRYILRDGRQSWAKFERAGFRYLQLTVAPPPGASATVRVHHAGVWFTSFPVGDRGAFACSDEALTRIWSAGAYTMQLCMQDGFEDCPSREQRQWVGDAYVESLVIFACFGDARLTAKLLRQVAQSQRRDGMTQMATPGDISARYPVYIVDYCLYWIMTAGEYVLHTGDDAIIAEIFPAVARALAWFERHIGLEGLLVEPPGWIFIDWAEVDRRGACGALNALLVMALRHAADMAEREGAAHLAARWRTLAERTSGALERLWDGERGVYVDALLPNGRGRHVSQHTNAALIAAGIAPRERWDAMLDYVMDTARLVETSTGLRPGATSAIDEERQVVLAQPFFMHWVHRALAAAGRHEQLVSNVRDRWAPMLAGGDGTFWEHWHGRDSRCHAWSATPSYDLSREVLGVRLLAPGFARYRVEPRTAGLSWAAGWYPSPRGDIGVSWRIDGGRFTLELDSPDGTLAEVVLPDGRVIADVVSGRHTFESA
ncbi:MAG: family 78 glycoside hydrolase catalytic domain [Dehalococcoidia bacterium]